MTGPLLVALALLPRPLLSGLEQVVDVDATFRVHYTLEGDDALARGAVDSDGNGRQDDVDRIAEGLAVFEGRWVQAGLLEPLPDDGSGGDARVDVYVRRVAGARGRTITDEPASDVVRNTPSARSAYVEIDPRGAGATGAMLARVALHEALHASQNAYSTTLAGWLREASATWAELRSFPGTQAEIDEHFGRMLAGPGVPMDREDGVHEYDAMALFEFAVQASGTSDGALGGWLDLSAKIGDGGMALSVMADEALQPAARSRMMARFAHWLAGACTVAGGPCSSGALPKTQRFFAAPSLVGVTLPSLSYGWVEARLDAASGTCPFDPTWAPQLEVELGAASDLAWVVDGSALGWAEHGSQVVPFRNGALLSLGRGAMAWGELDVALADRNAGTCREVLPDGHGCSVYRGDSRRTAVRGASPWLVLAGALLALRLRRSSGGRRRAGSRGDRAHG